jgi:fatty acid desaturase
VYDKIYAIFTPFLRNPRRNMWQRYVYEQASPAERRDVYWTEVSQFLFHVAFAVFAIAIGQWFLIVVVSLPAFYGGRWYHTMVHDTMHVGRQPETDDFRLCCRSTRLDPITSFLFWHMEYHTEHHTFAAVPCYRLKQLNRLTPNHWERPQSLFEAWGEMNRHSRKLLAMPETAEA